MAAARGTAKTLKKLEKSVGDGNYYEAHQMYRTVANRYVKAQNYNDAIDLLHSGAMLLLKHKQGNSGTDLAIYLIDVYNQAKIPVTEESRDRIFDLADLMGPENTQRRSFLQGAISWSGYNGEYREGDPLIQHYVGLLFWREKDYAQAEAHLLVGTQESAEALGLALFEWSEMEPSHDKGAYLLRGVLQELSMKNLRDANVVYKTFVERLPSTYLASEQKYNTPSGSTKTVQTFKSSLLNFTQLLLLSCETGNPALFKQLSAKYKGILSIDENFGAMMATIGELFFGVRAPKQANLLADLMSSLFSGPPASSSRPALGAGAEEAQPSQPTIEEMD
ncbi:hypothetical protein BX616_008356 [Lobosporangium transversale]|uniref:DUF410-domain-containing protein n=1 Tax=Lobosporangium transversale TaxID=64571 RepID=A0A1Y2H370_9FUNG|nr:hypothetical protein BCR41DRAFT_344405 [Lobosporangium transversale]KAF9914422.1 hypothetical protein BX616_008356 [Lobosporangium transversale]ORZ29000.1 hypothetical protein BCR41DRAFT_344405 [Lobosporangium transversale]|eukprot:XP_021886673.1 hypothetical protein BCR41DRAFT_344405 [Lobosporangium transversale]